MQVSPEMAEHFGEAESEELTKFYEASRNALASMIKLAFSKSSAHGGVFAASVLDIATEVYVAIGMDEEQFKVIHERMDKAAARFRELYKEYQVDQAEENEPSQEEEVLAVRELFQAMAGKAHEAETA